MSAISGLLSGIFSSNAQKDSAETAANAQTTASRYATDLAYKASSEALQFQRDALNQATEQFQPYLNAGTKGLDQLQGALPSFFQNTVAPIAQQYGQYETPTLPTFDYKFNEQDPVYQQKLAEANESIDKFLAKQGLQGSSAGEAFRQKQIQSMLAEEESRQYSRANDTYNRDLSGTLAQDQLNRQLMLSKYDIAKDQYGTKYGASLDLAKMGAGAAGSAGSASMATGTNMAQTSLQTGTNLANAATAAGDAQAQASLASGQAQAGLWQSVGNTQAGMANLAMQYFSPQQQNYNTGYPNTGYPNTGYPLNMSTGYGGYSSYGTLAGPYT